MFTDSHCHLADKAILPKLDTVMQQAAEAGICRFIVPATHHGDFNSVATLNIYPQIHTAFGIHPWFTNSTLPDHLQQLEKLLRKYPYALVGEIGLDFQYGSPDTNARQRQTELLRHQLELAGQYRRPVILHNLKSTEALVSALKTARYSYGGIAHAFSGSLEEARRLIDCGLLIGIGSLLLNPNAKKARQAATELSLEHIVLETDSPFMLPKQTNTPANLRRIAETVALLRGISLAELAEHTENNINRLLDFQTA
ncbi:hypothetical protein PL75_02705 [Neisseria arctica]|uniref:Hydrolase n=1 Tax=Neisseria arctica TaxID=1470200 RepID=A0A0J1C5B1_9NEIS|nr:TatD family hydrolase [Neisseria arctica]KLT73493.1 hypothetical protein PL75_02705 [Neisseria arctica]UOO86161.1 TatD family hydrolase [Neisseria arctica]